VLSGIDGVLLVVVIGDGKLVVPVDFSASLRAQGQPLRYGFRPRSLKANIIESIVCCCCT
jgi:hypothetical protein